MTFIRRAVAVLGLAGLASLILKMRKENSDATQADNWRKVDTDEIA